jgi:hypothetical protein
VPGSVYLACICDFYNLPVLHCNVCGYVEIQTSQECLSLDADWETKNHSFSPLLFYSMHLRCVCEVWRLVIPVDKESEVITTRTKDCLLPCSFSVIVVD